jgi:NTE family protein
MRKQYAYAIGFSLLAGCATTQFENIPLQSPSNNFDRRVIQTPDPKRPVIMMAFSGGGSRAAALSWAVLKELQDTQYAPAPASGSVSLVDDVALVSSVSGGSVTAAYFGLRGKDGLDDFYSNFLVPDNMKTLELEVANPLTWLTLMRNGEGRTAKIEQLLDDRLFAKRKFAELNAPGKPYVILNSSDMASGEVFSFTPKRFDDICSDFGQQAISSGVAASSAVPIATSPIALTNFSSSTCLSQKASAPGWIGEKLNNVMPKYIDLDKFKRARYANDLRHGNLGAGKTASTFRDIDYLYLVDGGVSDNLGVRSLLEAVSTPESAGSILFDINSGNINTLVVIVVNARSDSPSPIPTSSRRPGIFDMIRTVIDVPIDSNTAGVAAQQAAFDEQLEQSASMANGIEIKHLKGAPLFGNLLVFEIYIDFDQFQVQSEAQRILQGRVKGIGTSWTVNADERQWLYSAGCLLLLQHPNFQALAKELHMSPDYAIPGFAERHCLDPAHKPGVSQ